MCVFSDAYGLKRREGSWSLVRVPELWCGGLTELRPAWEGTQRILCLKRMSVVLIQEQHKTLVHTIKAEFPKTLGFFIYPRNSYFRRSNLDTKQECDNSCVMTGRKVQKEDTTFSLFYFSFRPYFLIVVQLQLFLFSPHYSTRPTYPHLPHSLLKYSVPL